MSERGFSQPQERTLSGLLDVIIPPSEDGAMPGAGEVGLASQIDEVLASAPEQRPGVVAGLAALEAEARKRGADEFTSLGLEARRAVVDEISSSHPALVPLLVYHTYLRYYQQGPVLEGLGLEARPPHPEGHELELGDLSLLDAVRKRKPFYRT